jgi:hypothetical protein
MIKKMVVVASGAALAFALAGVADAGVAWAQAAPPTIRDSIVRPADPPVVRDSMVQPGDPPVIRRSSARMGDPDDGGQITSAQTGDPDDGGQIH